MCKKLTRNIKYDLNLGIPIRLILRRREIDFHQSPCSHTVIYTRLLNVKLTQNIKYDLNLTISQLAMEIVAIRIDMKVQRADLNKAAVHMKS